MPQIWLSYEELAEHLGCAGPRAANHAVSAHWPRRRCSDGLIRTKLPPEEAAIFVRDYAARLRPQAQADLLVSALETMLRAAQHSQAGREAWSAPLQRTAAP
jgi:hypothetical protein